MIEKTLTVHIKYCSWFSKKYKKAKTYIVRVQKIKKSFLIFVSISQGRNLFSPYTTFRNIFITNLQTG